MNTPTNKKRLVLVCMVISIFVAIWCVYGIVSAVVISKSYGTLKVTSTDSNATLSVSSQYKQASYIGLGQAYIHLQPGTYTVAASDKGSVATKVISISKQQPTSLTISPSQAVTLPSISNVQFSNISSLVNSGITPEQATKIEVDFFQFKPSAKNVSVTPSSVYPEPRDPNTAVGFSIGFSVGIDNVEYNAVMSYSDLVNIRLQLYTGSTLVFDSYNLPSS